MLASLNPTPVEAPTFNDSNNQNTSRESKSSFYTKLTRFCEPEVGTEKKQTIKSNNSTYGKRHGSRSARSRGSPQLTARSDCSVSEGLDPAAKKWYCEVKRAHAKIVKDHDAQHFEDGEVFRVKIRPKFGQSIGLEGKVSCKPDDPYLVIVGTPRPFTALGEWVLHNRDHEIHRYAKIHNVNGQGGDGLVMQHELYKSQINSANLFLEITNPKQDTYDEAIELTMLAMKHDRDNALRLNGFNQEEEETVRCPVEMVTHPETEPGMEEVVAGWFSSGIGTVTSLLGAEGRKDASPKKDSKWTYIQKHFQKAPTIETEVKRYVSANKEDKRSNCMGYDPCGNAEYGNDNEKIYAPIR